MFIEVTRTEVGKILLNVDNIIEIGTSVGLCEGKVYVKTPAAKGGLIFLEDDYHSLVFKLKGLK